MSPNRPRGQAMSHGLLTDLDAEGGLLVPPTALIGGKASSVSAYAVLGLPRALHPTAPGDYASAGLLARL
jgi:hypothetical protein